MLRSSITNPSNHAHIAAGAHALNCELPRSPYTQLQEPTPPPKSRKQNSTSYLDHSLLDRFISLMTLYDSFYIILYYNAMVREPLAGHKKNLTLNKLRGFDLSKSHLDSYRLARSASQNVETLQY